MNEVIPATAVRTPVVLVVDDDADLRDLYRMVLSDCGCEVAAAANGFEALAYLRTHRAPSLILLDLRMPIMDGAAFRREQARDRALREIPVLVVSGEPRPAAFVDPGVAAVLCKPLDAPDLVAAVARLLS